MEAIAFALGAFLLALALWDLFQTIVVPRRTPGWFRIGRYLVRGTWRGLKPLRNGRPGRSYDRVLGLFAPAATVALLVAWLGTLILGYGLILFALRDELRPVPADLGTALYFAATSVLTLGYGDIVADGALARAVITFAAISGLGSVALVVTFLFSLYASYQRREVHVVMLQASAGAPPSAVALLETYAQLGIVERLPGLFRDWQAWAAEVLDSHVAYPLLGYFRSSHDNLSWISALGTVLDASSLVLTTIEGLPRGDAKLFKRMGTHLVEDISNLGFAAGQPTDLDRTAFDAACDRLEASGYVIAPRDVAWPAFEAARATYSARLEAMASVLGDAGGAVAGRPGRAPEPSARARRSLTRRIPGADAAAAGGRAAGPGVRPAAPRGRALRRARSADDRHHRPWRRGPYPGASLPASAIAVAIAASHARYADASSGVAPASTAATADRTMEVARSLASGAATSPA